MLILVTLIHLILTGTMLVVIERAAKTPGNGWMIFWAFVAYCLNLAQFVYNLSKVLSQ